VRSAPVVFGSLAGASGNFFCCFDGVVPGSCANTAGGITAVIAVSKIAIRQLRAAGNLNAIGKV
jgi:hypothetical protein